MSDQAVTVMQRQLLEAITRITPKSSSVLVVVGIPSGIGGDNSAHVAFTGDTSMLSYIVVEWLKSLPELRPKHEH